MMEEMYETRVVEVPAINRLSQLIKGALSRPRNFPDITSADLAGASTIHLAMTPDAD